MWSQGLAKSRFIQHPRLNADHWNSQHLVLHGGFRTWKLATIKGHRELCVALVAYAALGNSSCVEEIKAGSPSFPSYVPPLPYRRKPNATPLAVLTGQLKEQSIVTAGLCFKWVLSLQFKDNYKNNCIWVSREQTSPFSNTPLLADSAHPL